MAQRRISGRIYKSLAKQRQLAAALCAFIPERMGKNNRAVYFWK